MFARSEYDDQDLIAEARAERRRNAYHWCSVCHGHTGAGSPCAEEPEEEPEEESDYCQGCNPEPTISELEDGRCDSCGKELA